MFIGNNVEYKRMHQLEGINSHIIIIDIVNSCWVKRIINVFRCFNSKGNVSARAKFVYKLEIIKNAFIEKCVILGDFNLDYEKVYDDKYAHKLLFEDFENALSMFNLVQVVNFVTWYRLVGVTLRSSTLDDIYIKDPTLLKNVSSLKPLFGDHSMIMFNVSGIKTKPKPIRMRDWRRYSKDLLNLELSKIDWNISVDDVQQFWNIFESKLIKICTIKILTILMHTSSLTNSCQ